MSTCHTNTNGSDDGLFVNGTKLLPAPGNFPMTFIDAVLCIIRS